MHQTRMEKKKKNQESIRKVYFLFICNIKGINIFPS